MITKLVEIRDRATYVEFILGESSTKKRSEVEIVGDR
jgi:hypothetical protein